MKTNKKFLLVTFILLLFLGVISIGFSVNSYAGYENAITQEMDKEEFENQIINEINLSRSFKGLLPLIRDDVAVSVASVQSGELIEKQYLSYFDRNGRGPDERYSLAGGNGVTNEIIKGFENETGNKIKINNLLAKFLIQAIIANNDDLSILFSPYLTNIGVGFSKAVDNSRFVVVLEFVNSSSTVKPIKTDCLWGEKLTVSGNVRRPYKFKAVSIAYSNETDLIIEEDNKDLLFDNENIKQYLPPQDFIAYGNTKKNKLGNVLKGIGILGAIGAAPFTGGASAILAPPLISSLQNSPPKEIPLKGGFKSSPNGDFIGDVELNYQGMSGLYLLNILAELPGIEYPIVVGRRTVRVKPPVIPVANIGINVKKI